MTKAKNIVKDGGWRRKGGMEVALNVIGGIALLLTAVVTSALTQRAMKSEVAHDRSSLSKATGSPQYAVLNINTISSWMRSDGQSNRSPSGKEGMYYPWGIAPVVYQDGLVWGGKAFTDAAHTSPAPRQTVRVGGSAYGTGTRAGTVIGQGTTAVAEDTAGASVRIYRIRRDHVTMDYRELEKDVASVFEETTYNVTLAQRNSVVSQYASDWAAWPVSKGAPFIDRNGNGVYDPPPNVHPDSLIARDYDEPGVAGRDHRLPADQVIWTVYNDLDSATTANFAYSEPLGLEVQKTAWAYDRTDAFGNFFFVRYRIINKGGVDTSAAPGIQKGSFWIDSMYVVQWSDPDVGSANDDLAGCDVERSLGYVYNGGIEDAKFQVYKLQPPSVGYDLLAGPTVPAPGDSGIVNFQRRYGARSLGMSSFAAWAAGDPYGAPNGFSYSMVTGRWWKILRGYAPIGDISTSDQPYYSGPYAPTSYLFSGDPLTRAGYIDGHGTAWSYPPGERNIVLTSGPFRMAPGDTQEVYVGVAAGLGSDRLSSIAVLRLNDKVVQTVFDRVFVIPTPPAAPVVAVAELDGTIVLNWGSNVDAVRNTEEPVIAETYRFEGYTVYQLPSAGASVSQGIRIATFDRVNGITVIAQETFDWESGLVVMKPVQVGTDGGVQRSLRITDDYFNGPEYSYGRPEIPIRNGQEVYFAVTAYSVNMLGAEYPASLESGPVRIAAKARIPFGERPATAYGDTLPVRQLSGSSPMRVFPEVVDPLAGRGDTLRVTFQRAGSSLTWTLTNRSKGIDLLAGQTNISGDNTYPIVDGVHVKVVGPLKWGLKPGAWGLGNGTSFDLGSRVTSWVNGNGLALEEFNGAAGWDAPAHILKAAPERPVPFTDLSKILIRFAHHGAGSESDFNRSTDDTASYAYRFVRNADATLAQSSFSPWIVNPGPNWQIQDYRISLPLAVYNVDVNPPLRLAVGYSENNALNGLVDGYYWPGVGDASPGGLNNTDANGPMEWLLVMNSPYTGATQNSTWQQVAADATIPVMYTFTWNRRNADPWSPPIEVSFTPYRLPDSTDAFEFVIPAPERSRSVELTGVERIGVFPNPYYAAAVSTGSYFGSQKQFVTFNNLPQRATIRIFNLAGHLVRTLHKDSPTQFLEWNLQNEDGWLIASGMYLCHVELPDLGVSKVLKAAIVTAVEGVR